jgi:hypothetical protein
MRRFLAARSLVLLLPFRLLPMSAANWICSAGQLVPTQQRFIHLRMGTKRMRAAAMFGIIAAVVVAVVIAIYAVAIIEAGRALAQEHHERHHAFYRNWTK